MPGVSAQRFDPELRTMVAEASRALAQLDAARLEELALSCAALNRDLELASPELRQELARQAGQARAGMAVLGRVLDATRANLMVMKRIRELRAGRKEDYYEPAGQAGSGHGDD